MTKDAKLQEVILSDNVGLYSISLREGIVSIERNVITGIEEASFKI